MPREVRLFAIIVVIIVGVLLTGNNLWHRLGDKNQDNQSTDGPDYSHLTATWSGRQSCVECHVVTDSTWVGSDHEKAMQLPGPNTITANFNNSTFTHFGVTSQFYREGDKYWVRTDGPDGEITPFEVAYVFGHFPLEQFLIQFPDGRLQALNVCWDSRSEAEGGQRWFHLYPNDETPSDDLFHWTGMLQNWNFMCAECHSTRLHRNYDQQSNTYHTDWFEMDVSCEACHGPASKHILWEKAEAKGLRPKNISNSRGLVVNLQTSGNWAFEPGKSTATRSEPLASTMEIETCARCHARRGSFSDQYEFGRPFLDNHRLQLLNENLYYADGQNQHEVYVYGSFLQSKMYAAGVTCSDCHDPHSAKTLGKGDQVCAKCHLTSVYATPEHHFHQTGKGGDSCLDCHMQSRDLMVVDGRRDHSFRIPRPDLSLEIGTPNACNDCHLDQPMQWAQDAILKWYGEDRQQGPHYAFALHAGRIGSPGALNRLLALISSPDQPDIAKATALSLINQYAIASEISQVVQALSHENALVRASALRALDNSPVEQRLTLARPLLNDPIRNVRLAAARIVAHIPESTTGPGHQDSSNQAREMWLSYLKDNQDRAETQVELATYYINNGESKLAEKAFDRAILLEPRYSSPYLNQAEYLRRQGRLSHAMDVLQQGLKVATEPAGLHHLLGILYVSQGDLNSALKPLQLAAEQQSNNARFGYVYAVALHDAGQVAKSLEVLENSLMESPWDPACLQSLVLYSMEQEESKRALVPAQKLADLYPDNLQVQQLFQKIQRANSKGN